jgi:hypothetical protein
LVLRFLPRFEAAEVLLNQVRSVELAHCDVITYAEKTTTTTTTAAVSFLVTWKFVLDFLITS